MIQGSEVIEENRSRSIWFSRQCSIKLNSIILSTLLQFYILYIFIPFSLLHFIFLLSIRSVIRGSHVAYNSICSICFNCFVHFLLDVKKKTIKKETRTFAVRFIRTTLLSILRPTLSIFRYSAESHSL